MKPSQYNIFVATKDDIVLMYNTFSGALVRMSEQQAETVKTGQLDILDTDLVKGLVDGGFIVPSKIDEAEAIRFKADVHRNLGRDVNIVLIPTTDCNFACSYCFISSKAEYMDEQVADGVFELVSQRSRMSRHVKIEWFGGEPLLALGLVETMSGHLKSIVEKNGCRYSSTVLTNGYLLDRSTAKRLKEAGIGAVHFTLDGPKDVHDQSRVTETGQPTFDRLWANLHEASREIHIFVRISMSPASYDQSWALYDEMVATGLTPKIPVYFALLHQSTELSPDYSLECRGGDVFLNKLFADARKRLESGDALPGLRLPFSGFSVGCMARQPLSVAVGPRGELYKCGKVVGRSDFIVGSLFDRGPLAPLLPRGIEWHKARPSDDHQCDTCKYLPSCNGGCPAEWMETRQRKCRPFDSFIEEMIKTMDLYYRVQRQERS